MPRKPRRTRVPSGSRAPVIDETLDRRARTVHWAAAGAVLAMLGALSFFPVQSDDLFMYLAIGRRMVREGALPAVDPFLFSIPDYQWHVVQEWVSYLIAYGLFSLGGWTLLILVKTLVLLMTAGIALTTAWRLGVRSVVVPLLILMAVIAGYHRFIERASVVSDFFTAAVLAIVAIDRASPGRLRYLLPVIFLAWVNLHPGFYVGLAICGLAVLWDLGRIGERSVQVFAGCVIVSALLCLVNPDGLAGVIYPLRPLFDPSWDVYRTYNYEWMPTLDPGYRQSIHVPFFVGLIVICPLVAVTTLHRRPWFELSVLAMLIWLGFSAVRFLTTASFALCVLGVVLASKSSLRERRSATQAWLRIDMAATAVVALAAVLVSLRVAFWGYDTLAGPRTFGGGLDTSMHPIAAADFIDRIGLESNLYNQAGFGAYLAWRWDGQRKIFYHGHVEDTDFIARHFLAVSETPEQFDRVVHEFRLGAFLLRRPGEGALPLVYRQLYDSADWRLVFMDDRVLMFLRSIPENETAFARYEATVLEARSRNASAPASYDQGMEAARATQEQQAERSSVASLPIVGTWKATWCGLDVSTLRITAVDGLLGGTMVANEYAAKQNATGCDALDLQLTGKQSEFPLTDLSFDGETLRLTVIGGTADGRSQAQAVELRWSDGTLSVIADQPGQETRVFRRAQ